MLGEEDETKNQLRMIYSGQWKVSYGNSYVISYI